MAFTINVFGAIKEGNDEGDVMDSMDQFINELEGFADLTVAVFNSEEKGSTDMLHGNGNVLSETSEDETTTEGDEEATPEGESTPEE